MFYKVLILIIVIFSFSFAQNVEIDDYSLYQKGQEFAAQGNLKQAIDYYKKALLVTEKFTLKSAILDSIKSAYMIMAKKELNSNNIDNAILYLKEIMNLKNETDTSTPLLLGKLYLKKHDYFKAFYYFDLVKNRADKIDFSYGDGNAVDSIYTELKNKYMNKKSLNVVGYYILGVCYENLDLDYEKAIKMLQAALSMEPFFKEAYWELGKVYYEQKNYQHALNNFQQYAKIVPDDDNVYPYIAKCYMGLNDKNNALLMYKKALEINPDNMEAIQGIAKYYMSIGEYKKAAEYYQKISFSYDTYLNLGKCYYNLGEYKKAIAAFENAMESNLGGEANGIVAFYQIAKCSEKLGDYATVAEYYTTQLKFAENPDDIYYMIGINYFKAHDYNNAIANFTEITEIYNKYAESQYFLAFSYFLKGDLDSGNAVLQKLKELNPSLYNILYDFLLKSID